MKSVPPFILASASPRRRELLQEAGFNFDVVTVTAEESYPGGLNPQKIVDYIAMQKLRACGAYLHKFMVVTADTLVFKDKRIFSKPGDKEHAMNMLQALSDDTHKVTTSVCLGYKKHVHQFSVTTLVTFAPLTNDEITYYIDHYMPLDKAGSYGIQEWIGQIGVKSIEGSYTNVVGLPMHETYHNIVSYSRKWFG